MNEMSQKLPRIIRQGKVDFSVGYKVQTTWGFQEALTFSLEGAGATVFFIAFVFGQLQGALLGLVILMASGALLLAHLGNPKNMVYVMANFRHSWMSRGAVIIPLFIVLGLIAIAVLWIDSALIGSDANAVLTGVFLLLAGFVLLKSGLVMRTFPAIAFWNSNQLPILFALNGLASGAALYVLFPGRVPAEFLWVLPAVMGLLLVAVMIYMMTITKTGRSAEVSANLMAKQEFVSFYIVGIFAGIVLPLIIGVHMALWPMVTTPQFVFLLAAARIVGDIAMRNAILKVGVYDKLI